MHIMPGSCSTAAPAGSSGSEGERRDQHLGVGAVELRAGLEEADDVERRAPPAARAGWPGTAAAAAS